MISLGQAQETAEKGEVNVIWCVYRTLGIVVCQGAIMFDAIVPGKVVEVESPWKGPPLSAHQHPSYRQEDGKRV